MWTIERADRYLCTVGIGGAERRLNTLLLLHYAITARNGVSTHTRILLVLLRIVKTIPVALTGPAPSYKLAPP